LWEAEPPLGGGLVHLEEGISRLQSIQMVTWGFLASFSEIYSENQKQIGTEQKDLKNSQAGWKSGEKCVKGTSQER
jgi:hypothetical protein